MRKGYLWNKVAKNLDEFCALSHPNSVLPASWSKYPMADSTVAKVNPGVAWASCSVNVGSTHVVPILQAHRGCVPAVKLWLPAPEFQEIQQRPAQELQPPQKVLIRQCPMRPRDGTTWRFCNFRATSAISVCLGCRLTAVFFRLQLGELIVWGDPSYTKRAGCQRLGGPNAAPVCPRGGT
jgi:hypothetical protein